MKNKIEYILLSLLFGIAVLLGLAFWLNTVFGFNLFFKGHWDELAKLQAMHTPINTGFYISIGVAILIFVIGLYIIYMPTVKRVTHQKPAQQVIQEKPQTTTYTEKETIKEEPQPKDIQIIPSRPPRLKLPVNMAEIASQQHTNQENLQTNKVAHTESQNPYNPMISEIFSDKGYLVKPNPKISGFSPNLFAIAAQEILWIGAVDQDINKLHTAIKKLQSVFQETLEDIQININAFMLDTMNRYESDATIHIFKSIEELKQFMSEQPPVSNTEDDQESFESYSEYIDTVIQYIQNI